jgi:hypothetical protein
MLIFRLGNVLEIHSYQCFDANSGPGYLGFGDSKGENQESTEYGFFPEESIHYPALQRRVRRKESP